MPTTNNPFYAEVGRNHGDSFRIVVRPRTPKAPGSNYRQLSVCVYKLAAEMERRIDKLGVRKLRFHHLRHTTASLLLMQGADLAAVQRIMRHQDPRITTEVYGHLAPGYLKKEIDRLRFEAGAVEQGGAVIAISAAATTTNPSGSDQPVHFSAGGASERRLGIAKHRRGVSLSGREDSNLRPFRSRNGMETVAGVRILRKMA